MVAENDYALGQIVDLISHSPIWDKSLIIVIEDDSQDGADHVDAHRIPAFAISCYAKRGAVVHTRYDFLSFIRTLEIAVGMKPLNLFDATAVPLYDAFESEPSNCEPYDAVPPERGPDRAQHRRHAQRPPVGPARHRQDRPDAAALPRPHPVAVRARRATRSRRRRGQMPQGWTRRPGGVRASPRLRPRRPAGACGRPTAGPPRAAPRAAAAGPRGRAGRPPARSGAGRRRRGTAGARWPAGR